MAITNSAGDGVRITSAAKNGTLGSQASATSTEIIFDTTIATNNGNLEVTPTFVGRKVIVRQGAGDEETRYITAIDGTGLVATVNEAWDVQPASGETYHVSYRLADAETTGATVNLNSKTGVYEFSRNFTIGNSGGGGFAYFAITDYQAMEMDDSGSANDFTVETDGRFDTGYLQSGAPISGGIVTNTKNTASEPYMNTISGAELNLYASIFWSQVQDTFIDFSNGAVDARNCQFIKTSYTAQFASTNLEDITWQATGDTTNDTFRIEDTVTIDTMVLASSAGLTSLDDGLTETLEARNVTFVGNTPNVTVHDDKTWKIVNPRLWEATSTQIAFQINDLNEVQKLGSLDVTVTETDGDPVSDGYIYIYEGLLQQDLPVDNRGITNASGFYATDVLLERYTYPGNVFTTDGYGDFALKVYKYPYSPFVTSITFPEAGLVSGVTLPLDSAITETSQAAALLAGGAITPTEETTNIVRVFAYDNNDAGPNSLFVAGEIVTGTSSSVSGEVYEVNGSATSGTMVVHVTGATNFTENEEITGDLGGRATIDQATTNDTYHWLVNCDGYQLAVVYDFLAAKMAEEQVDPIYENILVWGEDEQSQLLYLGPSGYRTFRNINLSQGVYLTNRGAGAVQYFTADSGYQFVPPVTYSFTITGLASNSEVRIYDISDGSEVAGSDSTGTSFAYNYVYSTNINIYVVIFHLSYKEIRLTGLTISNSNQTIPVQQQIDRVYSNPS